ncbi:MAG: TetR/AcrR family transcriptional regulator [Solirubrobacteraceae bacterium]|nr:TetR/AcrR family transcriptional regulator [Solirubrobacteraceae bacterium]
MTNRRAVSVQRRVGEDRRAATRIRILAAARDLLSAGEPMAVMTVARVAQQAGVSRATFYLHFPDKRQLIDELARDLFAQWTPISSPMLLEPAPTRDQIAEVVSAVVVAWRHHAGALAGLIEVAEYDTDARSSWRAAIGQVAATIEAWLLVVRPDLTAQETRPLAEVIAWAAERSLHQMLTEDAGSDGPLVSALAELVWSVGRIP